MGILDFFKKKKDAKLDAEKKEIEGRQTEQPSINEVVVPGYNYLYESTDWQSFYAIIPELLANRPCFCITGKNPEKLKGSLNLMGMHALWITGIENKLPSASPERIEFEITQHALNFMQKNNGCVILIDDVDYLTVMTDFEKMMDFLKALGDTSSYTSSSVIVHICPGFFSNTEISLLKSTFDRNIAVRNIQTTNRVAGTYILPRMEYHRLANVVNGFGGAGRKLIISVIHPNNLKPFFGGENDYYFLTNTEQEIPVVRPWATETDFIITIKKYTERGGKTVVIDGLECIYSTLDFKRFLSFVKDITDIASRDNFRLFCVFNEGVANKTEAIAIKQRFDAYVSQ